MPNVMEKPVFPPYVCVVCGSQTDRKWYVDLQLNLDNYLNPVLNGSVILCNLCFDSLVRETYTQAQNLFGSFGGVEPTYNNEEELLTEVEFDGARVVGSEQASEIPSGESSELDFSTPDNDQSTGGSESETVHDSDDSESDTSGGLKSFRGFFSTSSST